MTYKELFEAMKRFTPEQMNQDVTVYSNASREFFPLREIYPSWAIWESDDSEDRIDTGHKYLWIDD